jgi:dihydroorotate dehydrogenase (fumarate)
VNLATRYLGLDLPHPLVPGAGPPTANPDAVRRLEDAGAAAVVLPSLFEEQLQGTKPPPGTTGDGSGVLFDRGPDEYLELIAEVREAVAIPVIASLNGATVGGWLQYARRIEEAGARALELNVYRLVTDPYESGEAVELKVRDMLARLREAVAIPLAVKLSPFHTSPAHFARRLDEAGADGLVLFNRFYQPDLDLDRLEVATELRLSDSSELLLRLRWLAILAAPFSGSLACTGGVHTAEDAVKAILAGAHAVQMVSALLRHGPGRLTEVLEGVRRWLDRHGFESLDEVRGLLSLARCADPGVYERAQYLEVLHRWQEA